MKNILIPALALFLTTAISTALLGIARDFTAAPIEMQRKKTQEKAMNEVLPDASAFTEISFSPKDSIKSITRIFEGEKDGAVTGYVVELSPSGYGGEINMVVGISKENNLVSGMRILNHSETPGLGALAAEENFYTRFNGKKLSPLTVVKTSPSADNEIEAITASTITSRAVTNAVNEAIEWYTEAVK